jgi:hypothetical protein
VNFTNKLLLSAAKAKTGKSGEFTEKRLDDDEVVMQENLMLQAYNCLIHDKMHALPIYLSLLTVSKFLKKRFLFSN